MSADFLVKWSLLMEGSIFFGLLALYFGHAVWFKWRTAKASKAIAIARKIVLRVLNDDWPPASEIQYLRKLPISLKTRLFDDLAPSIGGDDRGRLKLLANALNLITQSESLCKSRAWSKRLLGIRFLSMFGAGEAVVPLMLKDKSPHVRAQAAEWASEHPTPDVIQGVIRLLNDSSDMGRFAAKDSLIRMGTDVVPQLVEYLETDANKVETPALEVAVRLADHRFLPAAIRLSASPSPQIRAMSANLLGELGGEESGVLLIEMLSDSDSDVRAAAAQAVGKQGQWTAISRVAPLLGDNDWNVRKNAGFALRAFGSPGILMLRHSISHENPAIADISKQILDLHELMTSARTTS